MTNNNNNINDNDDEIKNDYDNIINSSSNNIITVEDDQGGYVEALHYCPHINKSVLEQFNIELLTTIYNQQLCNICNTTNENWLCLYCYKLYCGRYQQSHMLQHNQQNGLHNICLNLNDLSYWCYSCNNYIYHITNYQLYNIYQYIHKIKFNILSPQPINIQDRYTVYKPDDIYITTHCQPIQYFAVYGTLRTDDYTNSDWTVDFINNVSYTLYGKYYGGKMYKDNQNNFPYCLQTNNINDIITVQILYFNDINIMQQKLISADLIENYNITDENNSEYIRRAVYIETNEYHTYILCWIYFVNNKLYNNNWHYINTGDWCKQK